MTKWDEAFAKLAAYKADHGHCSVRRDDKLGAWVDSQRSARKAASLSAERAEKLKSLGFEFDPLIAQWNAAFAELEAYRKAHGDCLVPDQFVTASGLKLGGWCDIQRQRFKINKMTAGQTRRLKSLGFEFDLLQAKWDSMFAELVEFKQKHGHCLAPASFVASSGLSLGKWCGTQRRAFKLAKLSADRVERLESIGFMFEIKKPN